MILGLICILIGLLLLYFFFTFRFSELTPAEIESREKKIGAIMGGSIGVLTLIGMLIGGVIVYIKTGVPYFLLGAIGFVTLFALIFGVLWLSGSFVCG